MNNKNIARILGMAGFVVVADNWVVSPILPAIATDLHIDIASAGLLITAYMAPFAFFQLFFGTLADRFGKSQVITSSIIAFTAATGLGALGFGLKSLAFCRALTGVFAAAIIPISLALIGDLFPIAERQGAIGGFLGITFLGQGASMAIGGTIAFLINWRGVFIMYAILSTIPALAIIKIYSELPQIKHPDTNFLMPYIKLIAERQSSGIYTMIGLEGFIIIGSFSYLGAYISETYHFNYFFIGLIMTGFSVAAVMGGRLSAKLTDAFGSRNVLTLGLLSATTAFFILSFFGHCIGLLIVGIVLLGLGFIFTHSTLITRTTEFGRNASGAAVSLGAFTFMIAGALGTASGSAIIARLGISILFALSAAVLIGVWLLSFLLFCKVASDGIYETG